MIKNIFKIVIFLSLSIFLFSCDAKVNLISDGTTIYVQFNTIAEKGFEKLLNSLNSENQNYIDTDEIISSLEKSGYKNVKANLKNNKELSVSLEDFDKILLSTQILKMEDGFIKEDFSADTLKKFYNSSDEQILQFLDLLLAPVFNDEKMATSEYLEIIASFYGQELSDELKESKLIISSQNSTKKTKNTYQLVDLLCGNY